ncbi:hypothetical protein BIW11_02958 [Tropilaelaps mercedesae]|uniref:Uncharacterized protein n=1 Tax=Tropilaelaps mercedesae TaxID=418985 RepID=A0A1V9XUD2_9ACAR|nr:hypothetical protein BIW11_02958 [Tropilaelaps mercedesae]
MREPLICGISMVSTSDYVNKRALFTYNSGDQMGAMCLAAVAVKFDWQALMDLLSRFEVSIRSISASPATSKRPPIL